MAGPASPSVPTRLTSLPDAGSIALAGDKVGAAAYRRVGGRTLLTNDAGHFALLRDPELRRYLSGSVAPESPLGRELQAKGLLRDRLDFEALAGEYARKNSYLFLPPRLHIVVATLRCNHRCLYCHSSVVGPERRDKDMTLDTARKTVDFIFSTPSPTLIIEFQGGEPLLNWPAVKFIVRYAKLRNRAAKRNLFITMVSNFSLLDEERYRFLVDEGVGVCTSLDGPAGLHDHNRIYLGGASHAEAARWLERFSAAAEGKGGKRHFKPGALMTTTRHSLPCWKEIVDEYRALGLPGVFLRQLSPIGFARRSWGTIGYTTEEFLAFYRRALDYILELNYGGEPFFERAALTLLTKILRREDPGYVDMRSPSGAALGVLAYDYDGGIYTGDEARMLAAEGDRFFRLGCVGGTRWGEVLEHPVTRAAAAATLLENQPLCSQCAYRPYCGLDSVYNRGTQGGLWGHMPSNARCRLYMGIFDILFEKLQDDRARRVFESWVGLPGEATLGTA